jgi:cysteine desulfurase family protein (TIGR01976 family)
MNKNIRTQFPSLSREINNRPAVYLDGPAGTQIPQSVIDAMMDYYKTSNANTHGQFATANETDAMLDRTRQVCAQFLNASSQDCISFGPNMTSLCFSLSRGIGRTLQEGDEVVITQLDHEANRGPWLTLQDRGCLVREIRLLPDGTLDYEDAAAKINERTKDVAVGLASNMLGTVNDIRQLRMLSASVGAMLVVDAVHSAPHFLTDVQDLDCDFLLCSAYKFYGPHIGILYSKSGLLTRIPVDRLRVQTQHAPYLIETGTLNHAAIAGVEAALEFIKSLGSGNTTREQYESAFTMIRRHEFTLAKRLYTGIQEIPGATSYGTEFNTTERAPTIAFTLDNISAETICKRLGEHGIFAWDGHFYALRAAEILDVLNIGGVVRMGIVAYNTQDEVDFALEQIKALAKG